MHCHVVPCAQAIPGLRQAVRSRAWPNALNRGFTSWAFPLMVAGLMLGPQVRVLQR